MGKIILLLVSLSHLFLFEVYGHLNSVKPRKIDFAFVLFLDDNANTHVVNLSKAIKEIILKSLQQQSADQELGCAVMVPHLSLGHYGILSNEIQRLQKIVDQIAS